MLIAHRGPGEPGIPDAPATGEGILPPEVSCVEPVPVPPDPPIMIARPLRVALIGPGFIAGRHLEVLAAEPGVELAGIVASTGDGSRIFSSYADAVRTHRLTTAIREAAAAAAHGPQADGAGHPPTETGS